MAEITNVTLTLTMDEAKAIYKALGKMTYTAYGSDPVLAEAGSDVYSELTQIVEEDE